MSFEDSVSQAEKQNSFSDSQWFKVQDGENILRILVEPVINVSVFDPSTRQSRVCYEDCGYCEENYIKKNELRKSVKYLTWVIDRKDGNLKNYNMPYTVAKALRDLKLEDPEQGYGFSGWPMPYDINLKVKNAGTKEVEYSLVPRKPKALTPDEAGLLEKENTPEQIVEAMKTKARRQDEGSPQTKEEMLDEAEEGPRPEDIPF